MRPKIALLCCLLGIAVPVFAQPYESKITGNLSALFETASQLREDATVPGMAALSAQGALQINFNAPGLGRFKGVLHSVRFRDWDAFFIGANGEKRVDKKDVILFRGNGTLQQKKIKISGSIYKHGEKPYIHLLVQGGKKVKRFFYIKAPIDNRMVLQAKVKSVPQNATQSLACGVKGEHELKLDSHPQPQVHAAFDREIGAQSIYATIIATDADFEYWNVYKANTNSHIATLINAASDIYERQLGYGLRVGTQHAFTSSSGSPVTSSNANTLLGQFRNYTLTNNHLGQANLYHMFSGKEWEGSTVGLAYVGVACEYEEYSFGITQKFHDSSDASILAHELGHNFGAGHDSTNTSSLMAPYVSIPGATALSNFSISQIQSHLNSAPQCMTLVDDDGIGGGDGGGGDLNGGGGDGNPEPTPTVPSENPSIQLKASANTQGTLKLSVKVDTKRCDAVLYASGTRGSLGKKFHSFSPSKNTTTFYVKGLKATRSGTLYLTATYSCYSELDPSESGRVSVNLKKIRQRTKSSTNSLIGALIRAFR